MPPGPARATGPPRRPVLTRPVAAASCRHGHLRSGGTPPGFGGKPPACRSRQPRIDRWLPRPRPRRPARRPRGTGCCCSTGIPWPTGPFRAAAGELRHHHRAADERRLRLHRDAHQRAARRAARRTSRWPSTAASRRSGTSSTWSTRRTGGRRPADFRSQLSLIFEVLDALGIPRLSVAGYEADDIIATLATQAAGGRHGRADRHRRPGRAPAGQRPRHGADDPARHQRDDPVHPGRGRRPSTA